MSPFHRDHLEMFGHLVGFVPKFVPLRQDPCSMATGTPLKRSVPLDSHWMFQGVESVANQRDRAAPNCTDSKSLDSVISSFQGNWLNPAERFTYSRFFSMVCWRKGSFKKSGRDSSKGPGTPEIFTFFIHSLLLQYLGRTENAYDVQVSVFFFWIFETYIIFSGNRWTIHICSP